MLTAASPFTAHTTKPYYVPFRALMVGDAPNLLVAGKTMSQTFHANAATRLHPSEWSTGVAAGAAAVYMLEHGFKSTSSVLDAIADFQGFLNSSTVGQPLEWTHSSFPPLQLGFVCSPAFARCIGVDGPHQHNHSLHNNSQCDHTCSPLAVDEWLANADYWEVSGDKIVAKQPTVLKKSLAVSGVLPSWELMQVPSGFSCQLGDLKHASESYYLGICTGRPPQTPTQATD